MSNNFATRIRYLWALLGILLLLFTSTAQAAPAGTVDLIVQADDSSTAAQIVARYDGDVTRSLDIIDSVVATVDRSDADLLRHDAAATAVWDNTQITVAANPAGKGPKKDKKTNKDAELPSDHYASVASNAHAVHDEGITGEGVTVAIVDSGLPFIPQLNPQQAGRPDGTSKDDDSLFMRWKSGQFILYKDFVDRGATHSQDPFGHGTHVAGSIIGQRAVATDSGEAKLGVAPDANLVVARAIGADGSGSYADVIESIQWIVQNKDAYGIDVLNMSLHAEIQGPYWLDPVNQAVMKAWEAGITVVAAAGNEGPDAATIRAPGNVPYVITVGAYREGEYTDSGNTELLEFSSRGPTESRFVKPDVLMPGYKIVAPVPKDSYLADQIGESTIDEYTNLLWKGARGRVGYYPLSGTSMATAQASGVAALMLERDPGLTNDQLKGRLMSASSIAFDDANNRAVYSVWEQGAGQVNTYDAVFSNERTPANDGLDVTADLDTSRDAVHYLGFTGLEKETNAFVIGDQTDPAGYFRWEGDNDVGSSGNWVWTGGNWVWTGGNWVWTGGNWVWTGGNWVWTGGNWVWTGGNWVWTGGNWVWTGGNWVWTGNSYVEVDGNWVWTGGNWVWTGGNWVWTGGNWVWTGGNWVWTGSEPMGQHNMELGIMPAQ